MIAMTLYEQAKNRYEAMGIDVEAAMSKLQAAPVALHCWQGDDVRGFDTDPSKPLTGGIQTTGNYPGKARTFEELTADFDKACSLIPGKKRINLHASYSVQTNCHHDRDALEPADFAAWVCPIC